TLEPDIWCDDEIDLFLFKFHCKVLEYIPLQHHSEMRDGDILSVHRIAARCCGGIFLQVNDQLVAKEVEVDPMVAASAFCATQGFAIKGTGAFQITDGDSEVKGL